MGELKIDMSGLEPPPRAFGPVEVGDIMRTRQGKLYLIISMPSPSRQWRSSEYCQYLGIDGDGNIGRMGQCILSYVEANWAKVGHCEFSISDPEWF